MSDALPQARPAGPRAGGRRATVATNLRCDQACLHCDRRSPTDDPSFIARRAVEARVRDALAAGAAEIAFSGGEPALRADLVALVAAARAAGAERVVLETNATTIGPDRAARLRASGLDLARVNLCGFGAAVDVVTRDPGGFERTRAGLEALAGAGVEVEIVAAVTRSSRALLATLPAGLATLAGAARISAIEALVPTRGPRPDECLPLPDAVEAVRVLEAAARAAGFPVRLHPAFGFPPCALPPGEQARMAHLFALSPGGSGTPGRARIDGCTGCAVRDVCPGFPAGIPGWLDAAVLHPVREERIRRRLTRSGSLREAQARELVSEGAGIDPGGRIRPQAVIRVHFGCDQSCAFCFVSTHLPPPAGGGVERAITEAGRRGLQIALSGGEPTLDPHLPRWIALARAASRDPVVLQTNAVRLADPARVAALAAAGLGEAFVSLHGATAAVAETVTRAPGTFGRTLAGIDNLHRAGIRVVLNFVLCAANARELPAVVELAAARWPGAALNLSFVGAVTDLVPRDPSLIPPLSAVRPHLAAAVRMARARGVRLDGLGSATGLPPCQVPEAEAGRAGATAASPQEMVKTEGCRSCRHDATCAGVRRTYAEIHGLGDLRPVPPP